MTSKQALSKDGKIKYGTRVRFMLDQNDEIALRFICNLFQTGNVTKRTENLTTFRYAASAIKELPIIINYFKLYPLKTIKKNAFIKWYNVFTMVENKEHLNMEGVLKIARLAKLINDKSELEISNSLVVAQQQLQTVAPKVPNSSATPSNLPSTRSGSDTKD